MFSIGVFASMGRVSVRMLRHYDAMGLLQPARVDESSGYRFYDAVQLRRLNRLVALKELGFTLEQIRDILDETIDVSELHGMLRLRRAELREQIAADTDRLDRVEARLRIIESEGAMSTRAVSVTAHPPQWVARVSGVAESNNHEDVAPVIRKLFGELFGAFETERVNFAEHPVPSPPIASYAFADDGRLRVEACCPVGTGTTPSPRFDLVELPGQSRVASYVHYGVMARIGEVYQTLAGWIEDNGYRTDGTAREMYLRAHPDPEEHWKTQLTMPIE